MIRNVFGQREGQFWLVVLCWEEEGIQGEEEGLPDSPIHVGLTPVQSQHPLGWQEVWG